MNYLTRPIFDTEINWANPVNKSFAFELGEIDLGFGAPVFRPLQAHTAQGYRLSFELPDHAAINALDAFTAAVLGRLRGFWLPVPFEAVKWTAAVNGTHFDIAEQKLRDTWQDHPDIHLLFIEPDGTMQAAAITAVARQGAGERITVGTALNPQPSAATSIRRLHYVRLADDLERARFRKEGHQSRELVLVELPTEYAVYEQGLQPIYLYHFWMNAPATTHWRYTSFAVDVVSQNKLFGEFDMTHGQIVQGARGEDQILTIDAADNDNHPFRMFLPIAPQRPMNVEVSMVLYGDLDNPRMLFTGRVLKVVDREKLTATCDSWRNILGRKFPRQMIKPDCEYDLFDPFTCKAVRAQFETSAEIVSVDSAAFPPTVTVDLLYDALPQFANWVTQDWFANGFLETGYKLNFEVRTILASIQSGPSNRLVLTLNAPLNNAEAGQTMQLIRGCNGLKETCVGIFGNFINFGGFVAVPSRNLSLKGINISVAQGNKK